MQSRLFLLCLAALALVADVRAADNPKRPNVLWLIAEDLGPHLGCDGTKEVWTPNLDKDEGPGGQARARDQEPRADQAGRQPE
jgi:N-sulfoglucosamine sulfohydrolase